MHQVEIILDELKSETIKEFERIKHEASAFAMTVRDDSKERSTLIFEILKHDINELLQGDLNKQFIIQVETLYKGAMKSMHSTQEDAWIRLNDKTTESKREVKKCYEYAYEIVNNKDKILENAYKGSKAFLKSNLKESWREVKKIVVDVQEQIVVLCKNAKRRVKIEVLT